MHVTEAYTLKNPIYNNINIVQRNQALATLANGRDIFFIDMNSSVCDENGNVYADISYDGVHLKASAYERWHEFLKQNAVVRTPDDWIRPEPEPEPEPVPEEGLEAQEQADLGQEAEEQAAPDQEVQPEEGT